MVSVALKYLAFINSTSPVLLNDYSSIEEVTG